MTLLLIESFTIAICHLDTLIDCEFPLTTFSLIASPFKE